MESQVKSLIAQYFKYLQLKDVDTLLGFFAYEAEIHEPFSTHGIATGRASIESFLRFMTGINADLKYQVSSIHPPTSRDVGPTANAILWVKSDRAIPYKHIFLLNPLLRIEPSGVNGIRRLDIRQEEFPER
jgi:hypothetical protein